VILQEKREEESELLWEGEINREERRYEN